jgi:hypothetical protein
MTELLAKKYLRQSLSSLSIKRLCSVKKAPGETTIYKGNNSMQVKLMFGVGVVNTIYFSQHLFSCWWYQDVVVEGINLGGDPRWGYVGAFTGGLVFYSTKWLAHSLVHVRAITIK